MAKVIMLENPQTGIIKKGFYGFSWTTLFFSGLPALFRGDAITGLLVLIAGALTGGIAQIIWAFLYNKYYTVKLIEQGYRLMGDSQEQSAARRALGMAGQGS